MRARSSSQRTMNRVEIHEVPKQEVVTHMSRLSAPRRGRAAAGALRLPRRRPYPPRAARRLPELVAAPGPRRRAPLQLRLPGLELQLPSPRQGRRALQRLLRLHPARARPAARPDPGLRHPVGGDQRQDLLPARLAPFLRRQVRDLPQRLGADRLPIPAATRSARKRAASNSSAAPRNDERRNALRPTHAALASPRAPLTPTVAACHSHPVSPHAHREKDGRASSAASSPSATRAPKPNDTSGRRIRELLEEHGHRVGLPSHRQGRAAS